MTLLSLALLLIANSASAFDHDTWDTLLSRHVSYERGEVASVVNYQGFANDRDTLRRYLQTLENVDRETFDSWTNPDQLAFLINAYNAWTVELILTQWPELDSIKDLGSLFRSPWKQKLAPLLGKTRTLDEIEHDMIRGSGRYQEPRIHFAVNCASVGCPALRREAYRGSRLDAQLESATSHFLADDTRNRYRDGVLEVSPIFKWYGEDFGDADGVGRFLAEYAEALSVSSAVARQIAQGDVDIRYLDYDWSLNDADD